MANKTLKDMYPDVALSDDHNAATEASATKAANKAASELLGLLDSGENSKNLTRCVFRLDKDVYAQFHKIARAKGLTSSGVLRNFIVTYVHENQEWLDK